MLTMTENASTLIKTLAAQTTVEDDAGLRISAADDSTELRVDLTPAPEPHDHIVESAGAKVFLEPGASEQLADKVLDAQQEEGGAVRFAIGVKQ